MTNSRNRKNSKHLASSFLIHWKRCQKFLHSLSIRRNPYHKWRRKNKSSGRDAAVVGTTQITETMIGGGAITITRMATSNTTAATISGTNRTIIGGGISSTTVLAEAEVEAGVVTKIGGGGEVEAEAEVVTKIGEEDEAAVRIIPIVSKTSVILSPTSNKNIGINIFERVVICFIIDQFNS